TESARGPANDLAIYRKLSASGEIVNGLAFSPDGFLLGAAYRSAGAVVWDIQSGEIRCELGSRLPGSVRIYNLAFSPDASRLAVAMSDHSARLWDLSTKNCTPVPGAFFYHDDEVFGVDISHDGLVATAGADGIVGVWKPEGDMMHQ